MGGTECVVGRLNAASVESCQWGWWGVPAWEALEGGGTCEQQIGHVNANVVVRQL